MAEAKPKVEEKILDRVILTVGPKGRLVNGGIEFQGNAASLATGGRLTNWLPQIIIAAKRHRMARVLERKYISPEAKKAAEDRAKKEQEAQQKLEVENKLAKEKAMAEAKKAGVGATAAKK